MCVNQGECKVAFHPPAPKAAARAPSPGTAQPLKGERGDMKALRWLEVEVEVEVELEGETEPSLARH